MDALVDLDQYVNGSVSPDLISEELPIAPKSPVAEINPVETPIAQAVEEAATPKYTKIVRREPLTLQEKYKNVAKNIADIAGLQPSVSRATDTTSAHSELSTEDTSTSIVATVQHAVSFRFSPIGDEVKSLDVPEGNISAFLSVGVSVCGICMQLSWLYIVSASLSRLYFRCGCCVVVLGRMLLQ